MSGLNVVVAGVTGQAGRVMRTLLAERGLPIETIRFFSSLRLSGTTLEWKGQHITVENVAASDFSGIDIAVSSAGASASHEYAPKFVAQGAVAIDNSSAQHRDPEVPLAVPEVNPEDAVRRPKDITANPSCTMMAAILAFRPLVDKVGDLECLFVSSYQVVSSLGIRDVQELVSQTRSGVSQDPAALALDGRVTTLPEPEVYVASITLDVAPPAGSVVGDRSEETDEEQKSCSESHRILRIPDLRVSGTCVHIPVFIGYTLTIHAEFFGATTADEVHEVLASAPGARLVEVPTSLGTAGRDEALRGCIRQDRAVGGNRGFVLVLSGDNLRKGTALDTIQVVEVVAKGLPG